MQKEFNINKIKIPGIVAHITNVCNFNCPECQTFSNFNFTGHQLWKDYKDVYAKWADLIEIPWWNLQGGEPTLNPTFDEWIIGFRKLWPDLNGSVSTNGTTIKAKNQKLYKLLADNNVDIRVQLHNIDRRESFLEELKNWLHGPIEISLSHGDKLEEIKNKWLVTYSKIRANHWPECQTIDDWDLLSEHIKEECRQKFNLSDPLTLLDTSAEIKFVDKNNVTVYVKNADVFGSSTLIPSDDRSGFKVHNSDPIVAHDVCISKNCGSFTNGKLYKCHQVSHFPEFKQQFNISFDNREDEDLFSSYSPATADMSELELQTFMENYDNPLPQCKFCPESVSYVDLKAQTKKIAFHKKTVDIYQKSKYNNS